MTYVAIPDMAPFRCVAIRRVEKWVLCAVQVFDFGQVPVVQGFGFHAILPRP
jgi:hypothetical protein